MCTMVLKETLAYCTVDGGTAFCTLLDATKAFDRVNYCKLYRIFWTVRFLLFTFVCFSIYTRTVLFVYRGTEFAVVHSLLKMVSDKEE